jgi:hypothetical protein
MAKVHGRVNFVIVVEKGYNYCPKCGQAVLKWLINELFWHPTPGSEALKQVIVPCFAH